MKLRQKLIWFSLGAFSSGVLSVFTTIILRPDAEINHTTIDYLIFEEPLSEAAGEDDFDYASIAYRTGKILRDCGARYFETTFLYNDHSPTADLPIVRENLDALPCIISRAERQGITIRAEARWAGNGDVAEALLAGRNVTATE